MQWMSIFPFLPVILRSHSCFRLSDRGVTVVTDPPSDDMGYDRPRIRADVVTISHEHVGHNNRIGFRGGPKFFDGPGEYEVKDVFITGIATYHDTRSGATRGSNTVFVFEIDGVTIFHLGDLGHPLKLAVEHAAAHLSSVGSTRIGVPELRVGEVAVEAEGLRLKTDFDLSVE